ncbi:MAG TPA: cyclic nucleotide-binding domain-containing protein [Anaerolineales bacterium]
MKTNTLGKEYKDGEVIVQQGDKGDQIFIVQEGLVEVLREHDGVHYQIATLEEGEFFGEMAVFERIARAATVRALGPARVLTIDRTDFLRRIKEDPGLAFHLVEVMSARIRQLDQQVAAFRNLLFEHGIPPDIGNARISHEAEKEIR